MATALVTGASSGIGLEMATTLGQEGVELFVVARTRGPLEELAARFEKVTLIEADLGTAEGRAEVAAAASKVDILINNAGFGEHGAFASMPTGRVTQMIEVNCVALTELASAALPAMLERGSGSILNIASTAAFQAGPTMAVYGATKAYVLSFTEAIAEEVRGSGVSVTAFCPGAFASGFQDAAHIGESRLVKDRKLPSSTQIAAEALAAMRRKDVVAVPGLMNKINAVSVRFTPRPVLRRVAHYVLGAA